MTREYFTIKSCLARCFQNLDKLKNAPVAEEYKICIEEIRYQLSFLGDWMDCKPEDQK
jgi:hypothetical protein